MMLIKRNMVQLNRKFMIIIIKIRILLLLFIYFFNFSLSPNNDLSSESCTESMSSESSSEDSNHGDIDHVTNNNNNIGQPLKLETTTNRML